MKGSDLIKPRPYPAFVLLAVMGIIGGAAVWHLAPSLGIALMAVAALLLISFVRGLIIDLSVASEGIDAVGRVTQIDRLTGTDRGKPDEAFRIHFTFVDLHGSVHEKTMPLDAVDQLSVGSTVRIRYHPRYPEMWRWIEPPQAPLT